jgi:hypothetical protein
MLVNLRQRMAGLLISKNLFNEAKTEIDLLVESRTTHGFKIPNDVIGWQSKDWYKNAVAKSQTLTFTSNIFLLPNHFYSVIHLKKQLLWSS